MYDFQQAAAAAIGLLTSGDPELYAIVGLSLRLSLTASIIATLIGSPLGALLAITRFPGRQGVIVIANALLGLPPVVVGLVIYLLLSRSGPLGALGWLFTVPAMVMAQTVLAIPILVTLVHRFCEALWRDYGDQFRVEGVPKLRTVVELLRIGKAGLLTAFLFAFGRAISEVGAIIVVGGNIRGVTRTMTTAIALETSKGELALALGLGLILIALALIVSATGFTLYRLSERR